MDLWAMFCFVFVILVQKFHFAPVSALALSIPEEKPITAFNQMKEYEVLTGAVETGESRIIGGSDARSGEFPWHVSLQLIREPGDSPRHYCGGTLVSRTRVITAAHCVGFPENEAVIVAGARNISNKAETTRQTVRVESFVPHENYFDLKNDIAIIKLATPLNFTDFIQPLRLAPSGVDPVGKNCVNTGWGIKRQFPISAIPPIRPDILQKVNLTIWSQQDCQAAYSNRAIDPGMVCAGHYEDEKKGACYGDSGGPLIVYGDGTGGENTGPFLFGIVSFGKSSCGQRKYPTVYTRVNYYLDWIETHIN